MLGRVPRGWVPRFPDVSALMGPSDSRVVLGRGSGCPLSRGLPGSGRLFFSSCAGVQCRAARRRLVAGPPSGGSPGTTRASQVSGAPSCAAPRSYAPPSATRPRPFSVGLLSLSHGEMCSSLGMLRISGLILRGSSARLPTHRRVRCRPLRKAGFRLVGLHLADPVSHRVGRLLVVSLAIACFDPPRPVLPGRTSPSRSPRSETR